MRATCPGYHNAPVPPFGDSAPRLLIVGLAPGAHGANATGRPFTGDYAGILLYKTLHALGLATRPASAKGDDLALRGCRITNAVKCLPPANKPTTAEVDRCNDYLSREIETLEAGAVIVALGAIAHRAVLRARGLKLAGYAFAHGAEHALPGMRSKEPPADAEPAFNVERRPRRSAQQPDGAVRLVDSYHCSRYNTQTRRLTEAMFVTVMRRAKELAFD